jgi:signal transduction histidine kinase
MTDGPEDSATVAEYTRLISLAVHELRTPLSVVSGYLRMLRDGTHAGDSDRQRRMVEEAERSCRRLGSLLEELSELSKLDAGTAAVSVESFDVFALVRDIAVSLPAETGEEARIEAVGLASGGRLTGDRTRLRAALACAMRAVRREHGATSTVVVDARRTTQTGRQVALIVMALASDLEQARQAPPGPVNETRGGIGLGLPIARRVITRLGGRIWSPGSSAGQVQPRSASGLVVALPLSD